VENEDMSDYKVVDVTYSCIVEEVLS